MNSPLAAQIGQMLCVSLSGTEVRPRELRMLERVKPSAVLLFKRNCEGVPQIRSLTNYLRLRLGGDVLIAIDQEGGRVDRLREVFPPLPAASEAAYGGLLAVAELARATATRLRSLGINLNFAPVLDVPTPNWQASDNGLQTRTLGETAEEVTANATVYLSTLQAGGVAGCVKHFPGLGGATADPHQALPVVTASRAELEARELRPFRAVVASGLARAVMVSHALYPALANGGEPLPASLSPSVVTGLLREELNFDGLAVTDDLTMGAAQQAAGSLPEAARLAAVAGQDLLLACGAPEEVEAVHAALLESAERREIGAARLAAAQSRRSAFKQALTQLTPGQ